MKFLDCQAHFTSNPHIHQSQFAGEGIEIDNGNCISHTFSLETEERRSQLGRSSNGVVNTSKCESREDWVRVHWCANSVRMPIHLTITQVFY